MDAQIGFEVGIDRQVSAMMGTSNSVGDVERTGVGVSPEVSPE